MLTHISWCCVNLQSQESLAQLRALGALHISRGIYVLKLTLLPEHVIEIETSLLDCITIYHVEQFLTLRLLSLIEFIVNQRKAIQSGLKLWWYTYQLEQHDNMVKQSTLTFTELVYKETSLSPA